MKWINCVITSKLKSCKETHMPCVIAITRSSSEVSNEANSQGTAGAQSVTIEVKTKGHIVIPYTQGLCKSIKKREVWYIYGI